MSTARPSEAGFTLVEVLMVTFIVGLSAGLVVMTLPDRPGALDTEAARLEQAMDALSDRAVLTGSLHALELTNIGYSGVRYSEADWQTLPNATYIFPAGISLALAGAEAPTRRDRAGDDEKSKTRIIFDPAGAPLTAELTLSGFGERVRLNANRAGTEIAP